MNSTQREETLRLGIKILLELGAKACTTKDLLILLNLNLLPRDESIILEITESISQALKTQIMEEKTSFTNVGTILASCNFSNFVILLVKTFTKVLSFSFPLAIGTMYSVGINGCNPYTN
jgi:hypothetical protein